MENWGSCTNQSKSPRPVTWVTCHVTAIFGDQACYHGNRYRYHDNHGLNGNHVWNQDGGIQDGGIQDGAPRPKPKNWNFLPYFFIKANFEILSTDLDTRPKIIYQPSKIWGVQDAPVRNYKAFKTQFS